MKTETAERLLYTCVLRGIVKNVSRSTQRSVTAPVAGASKRAHKPLANRTCALRLAPRNVESVNEKQNQDKGSVGPYKQIQKHGTRSARFASGHNAVGVHVRLHAASDDAESIQVVVACTGNASQTAMSASTSSDLLRSVKSTTSMSDNMLKCPRCS